MLKSREAARYKHVIPPIIEQSISNLEAVVVPPLTAAGPEARSVLGQGYCLLIFIRY